LARYTHNFVEEYHGLLGFGLDGETDRKTVWAYLQMFSDDRLMETLLGRISEEDLAELFQLITKLLRKYLTEPEYHSLFLK